ncbi:MAG: TetR-like C-terminal domain-containing protein [Eubacteriales bacterium]|nr:TetR-like C-terminal domain-containing protein [Eubacteriales bacterium]
MKQNDKRVKRTKKALQLALADLMTQKELRSITVQELADKAELHRATFYAHYHDVYDLYEQLESSVISELDRIITSDPTHRYENVYQSLIDFIFDNASLTRMFLISGTNDFFWNNVHSLIEEKYLNIWLYEENKTVVSDEMRFLAAYHIQGCLAIISAWVKENFSHSKEEILRLIHTVDKNFDKIAV